MWFQVMSGLKINLRTCEITPMGEVDNIKEIVQVLNYKVVLYLLLSGATIGCFEQRPCSMESSDRESREAASGMVKEVFIERREGTVDQKFSF